MLKRIQDVRQVDRTFCIGNVQRFQEIPMFLTSVSANFCLFLAVDATSINDETISVLAKLLLQRGISYLCVWGPDCERVHDRFDLERSPQETQDFVVITTWHAKDSLSEALWFFVHCAEPADGFTTECKDWVALSIANESWAKQIQAILA